MLLATTQPTGATVLVTAVFLASAVEMVEALTIVLAVGRHPGLALRPGGGGRRPGRARRAGGRRWGRPWSTTCPCPPCAWWSGALLLVFGLQWLRKAVLRAAGLKAKHDEDAIFAEQVAELADRAPARAGRDATAFVVAFKGVFLEGLEVVVIVSAWAAIPPAGPGRAAAGAAMVVVAGGRAHRRTASWPACPRTP